MLEVDDVLELLDALELVVEVLVLAILHALGTLDANAFEPDAVSGQGVECVDGLSDSRVGHCIDLGDDWVEVKGVLEDDEADALSQDQLGLSKDIVLILMYDSMFVVCCAVLEVRVCCADSDTETGVEWAWVKAEGSEIGMSTWSVCMHEYEYNPPALLLAMKASIQPASQPASPLAHKQASKGARRRWL